MTTSSHNMSPISRRISFWVLIGIIALFGVMFYRVMANFLLPLFLAALLVVIFQPVYDWLLVRCGRRRHVSATLATAAVVLIVFLPTAAVISVAASEAIGMARRFDVRRITEKMEEVRKKLGLELPLVHDFRDLNLAISKLQKQAHDRELGVAMPPTPFDPVHEKDRVMDLSRKFQQFGERLAAAPAGTFKGSLEDAQELLDEIQVTFRNDDIFVTGERFDLAIQGAAGRWANCKEHLLGGAINSKLKELANPSPDEIHDWRDGLLDQLISSLLPVTKAGAGLAGKLLFGTIIMIVSVFFFFVDGPTMIAAIMRVTPLDVRHQQVLLEEFGNISRAVVLATLLSAVTQGVLAGLGFWFVGIESIALLILVTAVLAMIPFVGAVAVWVPVCLWLLVMEGEPRTAVFLAIYCAVIVSQSDNVVKPLILRGKSKLHPLLALLSILGGVQALGPIGILIGPMVVVFLTTLLNILHRELAADSQGNGGIETHFAPASLVSTAALNAPATSPPPTKAASANPPNL